MTGREDPATPVITGLALPAATSLKALTLTQPWASFVAAGVKGLETRSWSTNYRGPLAIHAAAQFPAWARALCDPGPGHAAATQAAFRAALRQAGIQGPSWDGRRYSTGQLPCGVVLAVARLVNVVRIGPCLRHPAERQLLPDDIPPTELPFGDYTPGRFAWRLEDVVVLARPVVVRGAQRLWDWKPPAAVAAALPALEGGEAA
jgi:hypothetical protein